MDTTKIAEEILNFIDSKVENLSADDREDIIAMVSDEMRHY